ncbi:hypothetical protein M4951_17550 [Blastopirellula sp. J2-11]|uniref:imm11 family protein n=1 Tax=Blastopirellula sp. J2-11 TaxID=2943192 RepID=UPI0021C65AA0|nr:DUF1629 domain-containing protein [Blastopirellula sp. J2-11]UUO05179.1 hypothetical protein M4951_17550 [Blastopirellula sp. J2-11]
MTSVYLLEKAPTFSSLALSGVNNLLSPGGSIYRRLGEGESLGEEWVRIDVEHYFDDPDDFDEPAEAAKTPFVDITSLPALNLLFFSERAKCCLTVSLGNRVEWLPVRLIADDDTQCYLMNVLQVIDCLDVDHSSIEWIGVRRKPTGRSIASRIQAYSFFEEKLKGSILFRLPERPFAHEIYVTEEFVNKVQECKLIGASFTQVWPPEDPEIERKKWLEKRARKGKP